eukprot:NODE_2333_length_1086_cov_78.011470_g2315_i0.p1 GENE.NODE_2333_length_1086_cov_78.011470_g2315_i0~~NODE_2333_length_1086_cov_78.011470_g2315_i0.p1  ORF type:complete len:248 (+),score=15.01 NODE_2333_length_1086_cov_78.011470_g2315_i0:235-978(+)
MYAAAMRLFHDCDSSEGGDHWVTRTLLLVNAECYSAWNRRKRLVLAGDVQLQDDLAFNYVVLKKHPKCGEVWAHRQWLLRQHAPDATGRQVEIGVCVDCAARHPRNYYAWTHRRIVAAAMPTDEITQEVANMISYVRAHVSDASGVAYLQQLIDMQEAPSELLRSQSEWLQELLVRSPEHEALWTHLRWLTLKHSVRTESLLRFPAQARKLADSALSENTASQILANAHKFTTFMNQKGIEFIEHSL